MNTFGIDVSLYQGGINFAKAKAEGVKFSIIKASESNFRDPQFNNHYANAKLYGIDVGAYHFLRSNTVAGAVAEAKYFLSVVKGKKFEYPLFVDVETDSLRAAGKAQLTEAVAAFCNTIENAGYWAGFYTNLDWYKNALDGAALAKKYSFWLATWAAAMPNIPNVQMWQYGGETNFIRSNQIAGMTCDQNYAFIDFPKKIKAKGLNGYGTTKPVYVDRTPRAGDPVRISADAIYPNGKKVPEKIRKKLWYVRYSGNSKCCLGVSTDGKLTLNAEIDVKYLTNLAEK